MSKLKAKYAGEDPNDIMTELSTPESEAHENAIIKKHKTRLSAAESERNLVGSKGGFNMTGVKEKEIEGLKKEVSDREQMYHRHKEHR